MLTIGLIRGSLPSYFPERFAVYPPARALLEELAGGLGASVVEAPDVPMDGRQAEAALDYCRSRGATFILLLHGGFTMGDVARRIAASGLPMGVWATPEPVHSGDIQLNNFVSLNMSLSIARGVRDLSRQPVQWFFGAPGDADLKARLGQTLRALSVASSLRGARIGVVGGLAPTFYNMEVSVNRLNAQLGIDVADRDMHELTGRMAAFDLAAVDAELARMAEAADVRGVSDEQMRLTARAALALRAIAEDGSFDALAVSDWPALQQDPGMHPGAAFSWLEETDALPVSSEGDVLGAVTQLAARAMSGKLGCLLDMTSPQLPQDRILMWHGGGGPLHMARSKPAWINHPMIGRGTEQGPQFGAIADFEFSHGPVTVLRIARSGTAQFAVEGQIVRADAPGFDGCRGWVGGFSGRSGALTAADVVTTVMEHGLEHHFVLLPGSWRTVFEEFGAWTGLTRLDPIPAHSGLSTH